MPASIIFNQTGAPAGVAGKARDDLVTGTAVTCTNSTVETTYQWTLIDAPLRSALIRGTVATTASFVFTPDVKGTYLVSLRVNNSPLPADNATSFFAIRTTGANTLGWRYLAAGEKSEDNIVRAGLGFPANVNPRGWATDRDLQEEQVEEATYKVLNAAVTSPGLGVEALVQVDTATGKLDASVIPGISQVVYTDFIYDSGATPEGNVYSTFTTVVAAANAHAGTPARVLLVDSTINVTTGGPFNLKKIIFVGATQDTSSTITFSGTATLESLPLGLERVFLFVQPSSPCRIASPTLAESYLYLKGPYCELNIQRTAAVAATGSILCGSGGTAGLDTKQFVLDDGVNPAVTFIYALTPGADTPTTRYIAFTGGDTDVTVELTTRTVINAAPTLDITASFGGLATTALVNDAAGIAGNITITHDLPAPFSVTGMSGGVDTVGDAWDLDGNTLVVTLTDSLFGSDASEAVPAVINGFIDVHNHNGYVQRTLVGTGTATLKNISKQNLATATTPFDTYNLLHTDEVVNVDTSAGPVSVILPAPSSVKGHRFYLIDVAETWGTNNAVLTTPGGGTIEGLASYTLDVDGAAVILVSDGFDWVFAGSHGLAAAGGVSAIQLSGATGVSTTTRNSEARLGGFYFDPTLYTSPTLTLRLVADYDSTDGAAYLELRLYDMGPGTGAFSPVLRSDCLVPAGASGERRKIDQALTLVASPGVNSDQIHNVARVYELRAYFSSTDAASSAHVSWCGFAIE